VAFLTNAEASLEFSRLPGTPSSHHNGASPSETLIHMNLPLTSHTLVMHIPNELLFQFPSSVGFVAFRSHQNSLRSGA
jgi:hypothetical protein